MRLLIEPVWNWNLSWLWSTASPPSSFNRTSMELKQRIGLFLCQLPENPFNRTSMELKHGIHECSIPILRITPFNRTSMELKPKRLDVSWEGHTAFNRTSMELKHHSVCHHIGVSYTFNRTSMELKRMQRSINVSHVKLLIEPVWNWNVVW